VVAAGWILAHRNEDVPPRAGYEIPEVFSLVGARPGKSTAYAWSLRNWSMPARSGAGAGPSPPPRSTVAMVVGRDIDPEFQELPTDPDIAPPGVPSPAEGSVLD